MDNRQLFQAQGLIEYAMILIIVAVLIIVLLYLLGGSIGSMYSNIIESI